MATPQTVARRVDGSDGPLIKVVFVGPIFQDPSCLQQALDGLKRSAGLGRFANVEVGVYDNFKDLPPTLGVGDIIVIPCPRVSDRFAGEIRPGDTDIAAISHETGSVYQWYLDWDGRTRIRQT